MKYPLTLRPEQSQAVEGLLQGRDILAILPTGYGKSMIFQVNVATAALKVKEHQTVWSFVLWEALSTTRSKKQKVWECLLRHHQT